MKTKLHFIMLFCAFGYVCHAQNPHERNPKVKLADIPGYITLKGDFHMHTVFSDGHVWPSLRVREAQRDGLDIIAVTEHMDYEGYPDEVKHDLEQAFAIAEEKAQETNVLVIKGVEISPRVPPYHNNAIFLQDLNSLPFDYMKQTHKKFVMKDKIKREELMAPFLEVQKQGGFVFHNHPTYNYGHPDAEWVDKKDKELFTEFHKTLLSKGILGGVEVVNGNHYNVFAHRIAEKYNLTIFANSDAHHDLGAGYKNSHRPMTLVFTKTKTRAAIEEAIRARRTAIYTGNYIIGWPKEMEAFFKASLTITTEKVTKRKIPQLKVKITNNTDISYEVKCTSDYLLHGLPLGRTVLTALETTTILLNPVWEYPKVLTLNFEVENILVSSEKNLTTEIQIELE